MTHVVPKGNAYAAFVLYDRAVWGHVSTEFFKAYSGVAHVSLTRHIAVTVLRNKVLGREFAFISYHAVTSGMDKIRVMLRREGDAVVRKQINRFRDAGIPVIVGADMNRKRKVFLSAYLHAKNRIDHLYVWNGAHVAVHQNSVHTVSTASDHDTLVAEYTAVKK
jgi:endonuclease/exonuclease/phosphatase (EEP) superfamily protein YafD